MGRRVSAGNSVNGELGKLQREIHHPSFYCVCKVCQTGVNQRERLTPSYPRPVLSQWRHYKGYLHLLIYTFTSIFPIKYRHSFKIAPLYLSYSLEVDGSGSYVTCISPAMSKKKIKAGGRNLENFLTLNDFNGTHIGQSYTIPQE